MRKVTTKSIRCKKCQYFRNPEEFDLTHSGEYYMSLTCRKCRRAADKMKRGKFKTQFSAQAKFHYALSKGKLKKGDCCEICQRTSDIHAHHEDYKKPLDVRWLCRDHHMAWHKIFIASNRE